MAMTTANYVAGALAASASFSAVPHAPSTLAAPISLASSTVARPTPPERSGWG